MSILITTAFQDDNKIPILGLTPTIRIRDLATNALVITDAPMSEVGDGAYVYDFITYDNAKDYSFRADGGSSRHSFGSTTKDIEPIFDTLTTKVELMLQMTTGRWKMQTSGPQGPIMIFYKDDNITEIARFKLYDDTGIPSAINIFERVKV